MMAVPPGETIPPFYSQPIDRRGHVNGHKNDGGTDSPVVRFQFSEIFCTFLTITFEDVNQINVSWYHSIALELLYRFI